MDGLKSLEQHLKFLLRKRAKFGLSIEKIIPRILSADF
jgi:hypothetical protein